MNHFPSHGYFILTFLYQTSQIAPSLVYLALPIRIKYCFSFFSCCFLLFYCLQVDGGKEKKEHNDLVTISGFTDRSVVLLLIPYTLITTVHSF